MRSALIKHIKIFTDGTIVSSSTCFKSVKQVIFYEKDLVNTPFFSKFKKNQVFQNVSSISYKTKYKVWKLLC